MKKLVLTALVAAAVMTACSKDDGPKCESCASDLGNKFDVCDNGDGTYESTAYGITTTITKSDLDGRTLKGFVEKSCKEDGCDSCISEIGNEFTICDNGDGTYNLSMNGITQTITEGELEGYLPDELIGIICQYDTGELQF